ncbi:MAG TPA: amidohydrolase [Anaeromyxobacteraceae bacterium]|jgi:hypothetical protein|nr:amidohydrolase [Anaeromyxobacteraceae bacterium]
MSRPALAALAAALVACASAPVKPPITEDQMKDDYLLTGHLLTPEGWAPAALVRGGRFACVGTVAECAAQGRPGAPVLDLGKGWAVPGLSDAHGHVFSYGRALLEVRCEGAEGEEECAARAAARARAAPPGSWIRGRGWNQEDWPASRFPTERSLTEAAPKHPVMLVRADGHAAWVNEAALVAAGIDADTPDPEGGKILRYADGRPSGVLVDNAVNLVAAKLAKPTPAELEQGILRALGELLSLGLTEVHDAGCDGDTLEVYRRLAQGGRLPLRVYAMIDGQQPMPELERLMALWKLTPEVGRLTVRAVKLYADGALGSRGAVLSTDYADDPGNHGLWVTQPAELRARIEAVARAGYQPAVHAIGDQANAEVLRDFAALAEAGIDLEPLRPRLEHAQLLPPGDVHILKDHWGVASMQPIHAVQDAPWIQKRLGVGSPILAGAYAWKTVLRYGVPLAFGSDFPIESPDPRLGLAAAEQRIPAGKREPWQPEQRLTRHEALRAYTRGAAVAALADKRRGEIRAGQDADLTVFSGDPLATPASELPRLKVLRVIVGGRGELGGDPVSGSRPAAAPGKG